MDTNNTPPNNEGAQNVENQIPLIGSLIINNNSKIIKKVDVTEALKEGYKDANLN